MESTRVQFQPIDYHEPIEVEAFVRGYHQGLPLLELQETFYLGKRFLGSHRVDWFRTNNDRLAQLASEALFCPACGDIWARRTLIPGWWDVRVRPCARHGNGSLVRENELSILEEFPEAIITYEFILQSNKEFPDG